MVVAFQHITCMNPLFRNQALLAGQLQIMTAQDKWRSDKIDLPRSAAKTSVLAEAASLHEQTQHSGTGRS